MKTYTIKVTEPLWVEVENQKQFIQLLEDNLHNLSKNKTEFRTEDATNIWDYTALGFCTNCYLGRDVNTQEPVLCSGLKLDNGKYLYWHTDYFINCIYCIQFKPIKENMYELVYLPYLPLEIDYKSYHFTL